MSFLLEVFGRAVVETFYVTGVIILVGFILGLLRTYSIKNFQKSFGLKAVMLTGFIGVPVHELSHAIAAIIFGHKISSIRLFQRPDNNGIMGYVSHSYNKRSVYQQTGNFFIGIAPIFGGITSIIVLMYFIIPKAYKQFWNTLIINIHVTTLNAKTIEGILSSYGGLIKSIFLLDNFKNPFFYLFLFVSICIASHISLSYADIKGASKGLGIIFIIILLINIFDLSKYISAIEIIRYNIMLTGVLMLAILLSVITFLLSLLLAIIKKTTIWGCCTKK